MSNEKREIATESLHDTQINNEEVIIDTILKDLDAMCSKYYTIDQPEVFKDFNIIYHKLLKLKKGETI